MASFQSGMDKYLLMIPHSDNDNVRIVKDPHETRFSWCMVGSHVENIYKKRFICSDND